jgi:AmmeMemoRadiSam system protein B
MVNPKLRAVDIRPFVDQGRALLLLRDPFGLSDLTVVMPQALAPLLVLLDGSRSVAQLRASLIAHAGLNLPQEVIEHLIEHLDSALLLESDRYAQAYAQALAQYRAAPFRTSAMAGTGYPAEADELKHLLDGYLAGVDGTQSGADSSAGFSATGRDSRTVVGLVSPHIDYQRGGPVYAGVWQAASQSVRSAELAIIFGTDHNGSTSLITLTRQNYATPYGVLPTAVSVVDAIASAIGEGAAFAEEMNHRREHSIELAAVWLHHMRNGQPCQVVPILCSSFHRFLEDTANPAADPVLGATLDVLRSAAADRKVVVVAAADLAHTGPAFGDPFAVDYVRYLRLQAADEVLIQTIVQGNAQAFYQTIARENNQRNVCGVPPIYMTLRMLNGNAPGEMTGYDRCPADAQNTSFVSVCGVVFRDQRGE